MYGKIKWVIALAALLVTIIAGVYVYRLIFPASPPQVIVTDQAIEAAREENTQMKERLDALERTAKAQAQAIRSEQRKAVDALPPDAVAVAIADELRLFLGAD